MDLYPHQLDKQILGTGMIQLNGNLNQHFSRTSYNSVDKLIFFSLSFEMLIFLFFRMRKTKYFIRT